MSLTVVLDGVGLHAFAQPCPPQPLLTVLELLAQHGRGRIIVPAVVMVEALTGSANDAPVNDVLSIVEIETELPLSRVREAAALRGGLAVSAADAVVVESAVRNRATFLVTADPEDLSALLDHARGHRPRIVALPRP